VKRSFLLFVHEWRQLLLSPALLAVGALFLLLQGCLFLLVLQFFNQEPQFCRPICLWMKTFWMGALLITPLLTMRTVAEERAMGTLDTLLTTSLSPATIVGCKYLACWLHTLLLWGLAIGFPLLAQKFSGVPFPFPFATAAECWRNLFFIAAVSALHTAIGLYWSTVSSQTVVGGTLTFLSLLLLIFGPRAFDQSIFRGDHPAVGHFIARQEIFSTLAEFQWGIFDCRTLLFHASAALFFVCCSILFLRRT
jgi:ABC-2 type transport system permease protein